VNTILKSLVHVFKCVTHKINGLLGKNWYVKEMVLSFSMINNVCKMLPQNLINIKQMIISGKIYLQWLRSSTGNTTWYCFDPMLPATGINWSPTSA